MKQSGKTQLPRRRFLQQLMVLGGATGASAMVLKSVQAGMTPDQAMRPPSGVTTPSRGYHLTEHIRTYYEKAQI